MLLLIIYIFIKLHSITLSPNKILLLESNKEHIRHVYRSLTQLYNKAQCTKLYQVYVTNTVYHIWFCVHRNVSLDADELSFKI